MLIACQGPSGGNGNSDKASHPATCASSCTVSGKSASAVVTEAGGTVVFLPTEDRAGISVTLSVPAGALEAPTTVTLTPVAGPQADPNVEPSLIYNLGPVGLQFQVPTTLTVAYGTPNVDQPGAPLAMAALEGGNWVELPPVAEQAERQTASAGGHQIQGMVASYGTYGGRRRDDTSPTVRYAAPADGSAFNGTQAIFIRFSERMDPDSLELSGSLAAVPYAVVWYRGNDRFEKAVIIPATS
ncbi:MAG TPA: hypothetical protein VF678_04535 [bacterium]